ncbi:MAG: enoyl-CoA hydratase/isomerase family protein [Phyllobacteriaceae bacterium]|nr:enoyl-CoA hydratase/isomerase family protein [Phyllobacteriaceae bacterium]
MSDLPLRLESSGGVARLVIDRPDKRNALTQRMWRRLADLVAALPETTRVLVISGNGGHFCAGADIGEFEVVRRDAETARAYEKANSDAFRAVREAPFPTLAAIGGVCIGGGFGLAAACDLRVAADDAVFAVPAAKLGLAYPADAMADIVHALGPQRTKHLVFSASRIDAKEALAAGFLLEVIAVSAFDDRIDTLAKRIAANAPLSNRASKAAIRAVLTAAPADFDAAARFGAATFESADYAEGRAAFREKRTPVFTGD